MTENITSQDESTTETEAHTHDTSGFTTVREYRHLVRHHLETAAYLLLGKPGLDTEARNKRTTKAHDEIDSAKAVLIAMNEFEDNRDFEAHQQAKAEAKAKAEDEAEESEEAAIVFAFQVLSDNEDDEDDTEDDGADLF